jgi:hypothetical protein
VQQYPGPVRAPQTIAILRFEGKGPVRLASLDGEPGGTVAEDARLHIEVLPGVHTLLVQNMADPGSPPRAVQLRAEPGKVYTVAFLPGGEGRPSTARVYEINRDAGRLLRDVTLDLSRTAPRPPRALVAPPRPEAAPAPAPMDGGAPDASPTPPSEDAAAGMEGQAEGSWH